MDTQYRNLTSYNRQLMQLFAAKNLSRGIVSAVCVFGFAAADPGSASAQFIGPEQSSTPAGAPAPTVPVGSETPGPDTPTSTLNPNDQVQPTGTPANGYIAPPSSPAGAYKPYDNAIPQENIRWSGYEVQQVPTSGLYKSITGTWKIPDVDCNKSQPVSSSSQTFIWVGLGGTLTKTSPLEQVGVIARCIGGQRYYLPFYEAFATNYNNGAPVLIYEDRGAPTISKTSLCLSLSQDFSCQNKLLPVSVGDTMTAELTTNTHGSYTVTLKDSSWKSTFTKSFTAPGLPDTAEWIVEDAPKNNSSLQQPLLNFGSMTFTDCYADGKPITDYSDLTPIQLWTQEGDSTALTSPVKINLEPVTSTGTSFTEKWHTY